MELKELKVYLGTGLMMHVDKCFTSGFGLLVLPEQKVELDSRYMHVQIDLCKPILRPLSDLTKPCLEGGKVPIKELSRIFGRRDFDERDLNKVVLQAEKGQSIDKLNFSLKFIEKLYEWHFWLGDQSRFKEDIIDINTL